jgi:hypothetical protein
MVLTLVLIHKYIIGPQNNDLYNKHVKVLIYNRSDSGLYYKHVIIVIYKF